MGTPPASDQGQRIGPTPARPRMLQRIRRTAFLALVAVVALTVLVGFAGSWAVASLVIGDAADGRVDRDAALGDLLVRLAAVHATAFVVLALGTLVLARRSSGIVESLFHQEDRLMLAVAHEVRSPLSRMLVVVDEGLGGTIHAEAALKEAALHGEALSELIDDLLETARVMSGAVPFPAEDVRLDEVARRVAGTTPSGGARVELDTRAVTVVGSPHLLRRSVSNLVRNAAAHAYEGGPGEIRVRVDSAGVTVDDDGPGVPEERLEEIRYETPLGLRRSRGGLGLALAGWVAEAHGGHLVLENRPGGGFRARLDLPSSGSDPA